MRAMIQTLCSTLFLLILSVSSAFAQEIKNFDMNSENLSNDYAECAAYYRLVYFAMNASNKKETANAYRQLENTAMFYSLLLAKKGKRRDRDMAVEVTNSRIEMNLKKMKQEVDNRNENISILINKYHFPCQERMESLSKPLK
jgi:hypothetical protein